MLSIKKQSLVDMVYDKLREAIIQLKLWLFLRIRSSERFAPL